MSPQSRTKKSEGVEREKGGDQAPHHHQSSWRYDLAFSFLGPDEPLARRFVKRLTPKLSCFLFSKKQEQLAGRMGDEAFSQVFKNQSRLNVLLFRQGYGSTPFTSLEEMAIRERCMFADGWETLLVITLEAAPTLPAWIPKPYLYMSYPDYGFAETAGVIMARSQERGAVFHVETTVEYAARTARARSRDIERRSKLISTEALHAAYSLSDRLFVELEEKLRAVIEAAADLKIQWGKRDLQMVIRSPRVSHSIYWESGRAINAVDDGRLVVLCVDGPVTLPNEQYPPTTRTKNEIDTVQFAIDLTDEFDWVWREDRQEKVYTTEELGDWIIRRHIDRMDRALERQPWERARIR